MARWGLPTNLPLRGRAHLRFAPGAQASRPRARRRRAPSARHWIAVLVPPACAPEARAPEVCAGCAGVPPVCAPEARAPEVCAGCAGVPPACAPEARAPEVCAGCAGIPVRVRPFIPPAPFSHTGRRGRLGVLMPEMEDGTPGLPTSRVIPQKACYGAVQVVINV